VAREFLAGKINIRLTEILKLAVNGLVMAVASLALSKRTSFGRIMSIAVLKIARGQGLAGACCDMLCCIWLMKVFRL